ncbi:hypothetical protein CWATWH0402_5146 [Crocosphaera watsonii WH 0402]|nr:DUF1822 family protein [Crocosphaera watsonii]CCQ67374.1 hypothetical protein CWATWH0402_5146 [Crocosphaera watsonii WH 0402]
MFALEKWLKDSINNQEIQRLIDTIDTHAYLQQKGFKLCLITQEDFLQEGMIINQKIIHNPDYVAHFYVAMEVLEEDESAILRGFISYDKLTQLSLPNFEKDTYWLSLDYLDPEPNHLLMTCKYLDPSVITLPTNVIQEVKETVEQTIYNLSNWLEGIFEEGLQTLDELINTGVMENVRSSPRSVSEKIERFILINFQKREVTTNVILRLEIEALEAEKIGVKVKLIPLKNQRYLPSDIQLRRYSNAGKLKQQKIAKQKEYLELNPFLVRKGRQFTIEVSIDELSVTETFQV